MQGPFSGWKPQELLVHTPDLYSAFSCKFSTNKDRLVSVHGNGGWKQWDLLTMTMISEMRLSPAMMLDVVYLRDNRFLTLSDTVCLWDNGTATRTYKAQTSQTKKLFLLENETTVVCHSLGRQMSFIDLETDKITSFELSVLDYCPINDNEILYASMNQNLFIFDKRTGTNERSCSINELDTPGINDLSVTYNQALGITTCDNTIATWDLSMLKPIIPVKAYEQVLSIRSATCSPIGKWIILNDTHNWFVLSMDELAIVDRLTSLANPDTRRFKSSFSLYGNSLAAGTSNGIQVWNAPSFPTKSAKGCKIPV